MFLHLLSEFSAWYNANLVAYPLLTKATTTALIGILGDAAAQFQEERLRAKAFSVNSSNSNNSNHRSAFCYDKRRGLGNIANNILLTAPIYHYGFDILESLLPVYNTSDSIWGNSLAALGQVLIDCIVFDALFVFLMYLSVGLVEGYNGNDETSSNTKTSHHHALSIKQNLLPAILASWRINVFLIPIEFVLFRYFPLRLRVLGMNFIDLVWEAVVSFAIHNERGAVMAIEEEKEELDETITKTTTPSLSALSTPSSTPWSSPSLSSVVSIEDESELEMMQLLPPSSDLKQKQS